MAFLKINNVKIVGFSAGVPKKIISNVKNNDLTNITDDFVNTTGVRQRRVNSNYTTADLCLNAAEKLINDLNWKKEEIDAIFFVSQTADYIIPATSCILQNKLGLLKKCAAIDISLGCSGWVYGMSVLASFMQSGYIRKALLCTGDTSIVTSDDDKLFGDSGAVTALEFDIDAMPLLFNLGTDGSGADAIMIPHGGARHYFDESSLKRELVDGHEFTMTQSRMKGMDVFSFGISVVPKAVKSLASEFNFNYLNADYFIFHQANLMMNKIIDKKLKLPHEKVLYSIGEFGNTSSASIPLTIVTQLPRDKYKENNKFLCCGFGVGLSWGVISFETNNLTISELVELE